MRRIRTIAWSFLGTMVLLVGLAFAIIGEDAVEAGHGPYRYRVHLAELLTPRSSKGPLVAWIGDSTIFSVERPEYPQRVERRLQQELGPLESRVVAAHLLDFFSFYFLMGPVIDLHPDVVVLVAHLRFFHRQPTNVQGVRISFNDLCSMLPTRELPTALRLPLYERGLSPLDLGLARLLRFDLGERTLFFAEGLRGMMHGVAARFTSPSPGGAEKTQQFVDAWMLAALADYVTPITPEEPVVRMMAATVRMATARGVPVVVIGSPVPWTALATHGWWDAQAFADRFTTLGAVVTESGGRFLDLHTALGPDGFSDTAGHFTPAGVERIAELVTPVVRDLLHQRAAPVAQAPESVFGMVTAGSQPRRRVPRPRSAS